MVKIIKLGQVYIEDNREMNIFMVEYSDVPYVGITDIILDLAELNLSAEYVENYFNTLDNKYSHLDSYGREKAITKEINKFIYKQDVVRNCQGYKFLKPIWREANINNILV